MAPGVSVASPSDVSESHSSDEVTGPRKVVSVDRLCIECTSKGRFLMTNAALTLEHIFSSSVFFQFYFRAVRLQFLVLYVTNRVYFGGVTDVSCLHVFTN